MAKKATTEEEKKIIPPANEGGDEGEGKGEEGGAKNVELGGEEMVQVKKSDLDLIFKKMEDLSRGQADLFKVADKNRLARLAESAGGALIRQVKISKWPRNDQYIVGWKLTKNLSEIMPGTGRWVEDQSTTLFFEDQTFEDVPLIDFYRMPIKELADIIETNNVQRNGKSFTVFTVEFENGKKLSIDSNFVN